MSKNGLTREENRKAWLYAFLIVLGMGAVAALLVWSRSWNMTPVELRETNPLVTEAARGLDEITVDGFFEQYKDLLGGAVSYGFPACCSIEELRERMDREHIRVFVIDASLGLCGFVLAQEVELQCQSPLIK